MTDTAIFLERAKAAYLRALDAQSMGHGDRNITQQQIDKLSAEVDKWQARYNAERGVGPSGVMLAGFGGHCGSEGSDFRRG